MDTNIRSFKPIEKLGEGSFASVYKVERVCDHQIYALKKIRMGHLPPKARQNSLNEVRLLASLQSPYITKYYQAFFDEQIDCLCIVMEWADQGDLRRTINKAKQQRKLMTQIEIWKLAIHLLHGLKILHDNTVLHRDLKCENILISGEIYKIGDMNVSKINKDGMVFTQTGTPYYASPEVWKDQPYDQKSDIWSLGCILYEMACLKPPFTGSSMNDLHRNIMRGVYNPIPKVYSNELAAIIYDCLKQNPKERPSVDDLLTNWSLKMYQNLCLDYRIEAVSTNVQMLKTINMPKNIKDLNKCLPKANYQSEKQEKKVEVQEKSQIPEEKRVQSENIQQEGTSNQISSMQERSKSEQKEKSINLELAVVKEDGKGDEEGGRLEIQSKQMISLQELQEKTEVSSIPFEQKQTQDSSRQKIIISSQPDLQIYPNLKNKKACSLNEIDKHEQDKLQPHDKQAASAKSLQEIQSFNRLIERIKASAKMSAKKIEKIEPKKPRRQLKDLNSNKLVQGCKRQRSRSLKRTERSMSREHSKELMKKESSKQDGLNYKICSYTDRKSKGNTQNLQKVLSSKYLLAPVTNKYTKILQQAKGYLKRSASRKHKIF